MMHLSPLDQHGDLQLIHSFLGGEGSLQNTTEIRSSDLIEVIPNLPIFSI